MRRTYIIALLLLSFSSKGQLINPGNNTPIFPVIVVPKGVTSISYNYGGILDTGSLRYNVSDSSLYVHTGSQFLKIGGSGGSGGPETDPVVKAISGIVKSNGSTISAATAGTDYLTPSGNGSSLTGITASQVGLGNVTNESKATMFTSPTFTGTVTLPASTSLTTPVLGAATGTSLAATGAITSSGTAGVGYATGAGGTVTQTTNKSTAVTLNKTCGQITMSNAALGAGAEVSFTLNNSTIASTDVVVVNVQSVGTAGSYLVSVGSVSAGACTITVSNASTGSLSQALVLNFSVIKSVNN